MSLALGFSPSQRRTSKLEPSFSHYRSKDYGSDALPIHIPMENDSSSSAFESSSGCITRWFFRNCNANCTDMQKSPHRNEGNAFSHKVMVPKIPSIAVSFSQTIVGGFIGSKSHAGRSFFGESSLLCDAIMCKLVQLVSMGKEKTPDNVSGPKSTLSNMKNSKMCHFSDTNFSSLSSDKPSNGISDSMADSKLSDSTLMTINYGLPLPCGNSSDLGVTRVSKSSPKLMSVELCDSIEFMNKKQTKDCEILSTPQRETYSSVVDGTRKNSTRCVQQDSCVVIKSPKDEHPSEILKVSSPLPLKQSYADVAKTVPHKSLESQKNIGREMIKRRFLSCEFNREKKDYRSCPKIKVMRPVTASKSPSMDEIMTNGDTRWRADWKMKRPKLQRSHSIAVPSRTDGSVNDQRVEHVVERCISESGIGLESGRCLIDNVVTKTEFPKCGLRGRYPSECSLDSDDSFVVFEDCPDAGTSPYSSLEADEESSSSCDDSDSEDTSLDSLNSSPLCSSKMRTTNFNLGNGFSAYIVPENGSKALQKKKVRFAEGCHLAVIRPMIAWGYAYRESRRGPWEVHARDRARFRCRIDSLAPLLNSVLDSKHRERILESRFSER